MVFQGLQGCTFSYPERPSPVWIGEEPPSDLLNIFYRYARYCIYNGRTIKITPSLRFFINLVSRDELKEKHKGTEFQRYAASTKGWWGCYHNLDEGGNGVEPNSSWKTVLRCQRWCLCWYLADEQMMLMLMLSRWADELISRWTDAYANADADAVTPSSNTRSYTRRSVPSSSEGHF